MPRDATRTTQRREAAFREALARELAARAPTPATLPQLGSRPQWVTPHVLKSAAWFARRGMNARRAGITREETFPVRDARACLRIPGARPDAPLCYPAPEHAPGSGRPVTHHTRRKKRRGKLIDVAPYVARLAPTHEDTAPDYFRYVAHAGPSARPLSGKVDPATGALV